MNGDATIRSFNSFAMSTWAVIPYRVVKFDVDDI